MIKASTDYALNEFKKLADTNPVDYLYLLYNPDETLVIKWVHAKAIEYIMQHEVKEMIEFIRLMNKR